MPDHFFIMPGFMLDKREHISCCLFVIFVMINVSVIILDDDELYFIENTNSKGDERLTDYQVDYKP